VAPIVRKPAFRKSSWRSRQANQECFSERHVSLMTLTVISSNEQRVKQPTYAVVQVPRLSSLSEGIAPRLTSSGELRGALWLVKVKEGGEVDYHDARIHSYGF
jgi:hypothetical protein